MIKGEKLLYQENKLAYHLVLVFIILNTAAAILTLRSMALGFRTGSFILYTIVISLVSFLLAIKVKKYSMNWGIISIVLGISQILRSFIMPELPSSGRHSLVIVLTIASALFLIAGGVITINKASIRRNYLTHRNVKG